jgi:23S rRNA pseudouridine2605 synthase
MAMTKTKTGRFMRRSKPASVREKPGEAPAESGSDRLQKVMAASGMGSRRALEKLISAGMVLVNGQPAKLGQSVRAGDRIRFQDRDWQVTAETAHHRTLIYNKPEGELTTRSDPEGRPTVFDRLPWLADARWVAVGRLDINTTGLLLLTTDGELANALMHPSSQVDREYVCRIRGLVSDEQLEQLREGVLLDGSPARFSDIQRMAVDGTAGNQWFQVTILEGRNREVRRLWEAVGCMVSRLKRVRYGAATLPKGLRVGTFSEVTPRDHRVLRQDVRLPVASARLILQEVKTLGKPARPTGRKMPTVNVQGQAADRPARPTGTRGKYSGGGRTRGSASDRTDRPARPDRSARPSAKPGSPAGAGRRPHPRSRKAQRG